MFSNFRDTFIKKPQFTSKIPDAVLKTVGKTLPDGFRYVEDYDGYCRLDCDGSLDISGFHVATVYKGNIIKNLIMDCQSYTKYRPNETTGGIFVSWRRKEELPTGA